MWPRLPGAVLDVSKRRKGIGLVLAGMRKHEEALVECQQSELSDLHPKLSTFSSLPKQ